MDEPDAADADTSGLEAGLAAFFRDRSRAPDPEPAAAGPPERLGEFRIVRELGRGAMGVVYLAEQDSLRRRVAVKVLAPELVASPDAIRRFRQEATSAARLRHPAIAQVFAVGEDAGTRFLAMELVDGVPLDRVLDELRSIGLDRLDGAAIAAALDAVRRSSQIDDVAPATESGSTVRRERRYVDAACLLVAGIAQALHHAHEAGVIHRDVKPSNVLVRADGSPVLTDFGLARPDDAPGVTRTGVFAGTPHYTSPEQADPGSSPVDRRSDVFALGVTLFELLTLRRPFEGTTRQVLDRIAGDDAPSARRFCRRLPRDVATIVAKALERDPMRRYQTAGALAEDLHAFVEMRPIAARPASIVTVATRAIRRHRAASAAVAAALAVTGGLAVGRWLQTGRLTVDSHPRGALVILDRLPRGETPFQADLDPGRHELRLETRDGTRFSGIEHVEIERGDETSVDRTLLSFEEIVGQAARDDERAVALLHAPIDALRRLIADRLRADLATATASAARGGLNDVALLRNTILLLDRALPDSSAAQQLDELVRDAHDRQQKVDAETEEITRAIAAGRVEGVGERISVLDALRLGPHPFEPARRAAADLRRQLLELGLSHAEADSGERLRIGIEALEAVETGRAELAAMRNRLRLLQRYESIDESTPLEELEASLDEMSRIDGDHRFTAEVRRRCERLRARLAFESSWSTLQERLDRATRVASPSALEGVVEDTERLLEGSSDDGREALDELLAQARRALEAVRELRGIEEHAEAEPDEAAARLDDLETALHPELAAVLRPHLASAHERIATCEQRLRVRRSCDAIHDACRRLRTDGARAGLEALRSELPTDDPDIRARIAAAEDALHGAEADEARLGMLDVEYRRFRERLRDPSSPPLQQELERLESGWRTASERLSAAIDATGPPALLLLRARLALWLGDFDAAERDATRALELGAGSDARMVRGQARYALANPRTFEPSDAVRTALSDFEAADPADPLAGFWRGTCLNLLDRRDEALTALRDAIAAGLESADARYQAVDLCLSAGAPRDALAFADAALNSGWSAADVVAAFGTPRQAVQAGGGRTFQRDAYLIRAEAFFDLRQLDRCVADCDRALELDRASARAWHRKGWALAEAGRRDDAVGALREAERLAARDQDARLRDRVRRLLDTLQRSPE